MDGHLSAQGVKSCFGTPEPAPPISANGRPTTRTSMLALRREKEMADLARTGDKMATPIMPVGVKPGAPYTHAATQIPVCHVLRPCHGLHTLNCSLLEPSRLERGKNPGQIDAFGVNTMKKFQHTDVEIYLKRPLLGT